MTKSERKSKVAQPTTSSTLVVYNSRPLLATYVCNLPGILVLLAVLSPSVPTFN